MNTTDNSLLKGHYTIEHYREGKLLERCEFDNIVVDQGRDYLLNTALRGTSQESNWYIGLFKGNYTPVHDDDNTNIASNSTEFTDYDESDRPAATFASASGGVITNSANRAEFTINGSGDIYGAFLISSDIKNGSGAAVLLSAGRFPAKRTVQNQDTLVVAYSLSTTSV